MDDFTILCDRHGQPGYHSLAELPQRNSIAESTRSTGWYELDELWKLYPSQFTVVTGVAGHGKSTLIMNVLCNMAILHGTRSFLYVPENEGFLRQKLRLIWGHRDGFEQFSAEQCFIQSSMPAHYDDAPKTLQWVLGRALVAVEQDGVDVLMIDPWNELERAMGRGQLLTDYIAECLMYLKAFARSTGCAIIVCAHPTKAGIADGKTPTLSDIEGSMNWFNKCDNGLICARDPDKNSCRVISAKVREIGAGRRGAAYFDVDPQTGIFTPQFGAVSL